LDSLEDIVMTFTFRCLVQAGVCLACATFGLPAAWAQTAGGAIDPSVEFEQLGSVYYVPAAATRFDAASGAGTLRWDRYRQAANLSFNKVDAAYARAESNEFPGTEYDRDPKLPFAVEFVSPRAVRLRFATRDVPLGDAEDDAKSLMLAGPVPRDDSWKVTEDDGVIVCRSAACEVRIRREPWGIEVRDADGQLVTRTRTLNDPPTYVAPTPFSFVRRSRDLGHSTAASFALAPDEKIFGCGESFTRFDKRGQKINLWTRDGMGVQNQRMYKPVPFFMSSAGYGMFIHTSAPVTCDFGHDYDAATVLSTGDETLDLFVFVGTPKEILTEYTAITGRSPVPPLWSFGLWMSRITYKSEAEVRDVAAKLREHKIPCDVIHLDTGWFETDWQCDYKFAASRFDDPKQMMADLKEDGFHVSLWQLPYFTRKNALFETIVDKGYAVRNEGGSQPYLDAVLDFSNPETVAWYQGLLRDLLKLGVGAIKVDFGEDAPVSGVYASGRTGWYEHNLYPLRYNKTVAELTKDVTGESIIWARSAWAGSQRYPLHWGGDAENSDSAMAATLRSGMSLGLCGFSYWSHDVGGFVGKPSEDLYRRWLAFGVLTSHTRCHGAPPREPWEYSKEFEDDFRRAVELKYQLMPYYYEQAKAASAAGHPMLRPLFFEFPEDAGSWLVDDQYMFGSDLLVAPMITADETRSVYLPPGSWVDYQSDKEYEGGRFHEITPGQIPVVLLVRGGASIPHVPLVQSTAEMDLEKAERRAYGDE
jgi:alpha-D-xyloside xylohydrolase